MPKPVKKIIDVVPLTRIPLDRNQSFSYLYDRELPVGTLVTMPLFRRKVEGIVIGAKDDFKRLGNIELKNIEEVIEESFLDRKQIDLAQFISDHYFSPLGVVMKSFVPKRMKERSAKKKNQKIERVIPKIKLTPEQDSAVKIISGNSKFEIRNSKFLLHGPASSGKTEVYIHSFLALQKKDRDIQFLVLLPEQTLTPQAIDRYGEYFAPEEIVVLSSNISKGKFYSAWQKIRSGEAKIIIGTRMAVFAPFKKLGLVIIDEEQDISFKQWDMNPRYDARTASGELARLHDCGLVMGSATPRIEDYYQAKDKDRSLLELPRLRLAAAKNHELRAEIVDMRKERWIKNYSTISKKLEGEIAYALKNKLQTILLVSRQGMSAFSICDSCKTVLKCPKCDRALIYDRDGTYHCLHCSYKTSILAQCPKCRGTSFKNIGLGTQKVEKELRDTFSSAIIIRADNQTTEKTGSQEEIYRTFSERKADILIGTQMISKGWDLPNVALIGIIDTDNMLSLPDFSVSERAFQNIVQVAGRSDRPGAKFPGTVVIQTFDPRNWIIRLAADRNYPDFFKKEIADRQALGLPPFKRLLKLVFQEYDFEKAALEANRVYDLLKDLRGIRVMETQESFVPKVRGRYRRQLTLKFKDMTPELGRIIRNLPAGWIIDVDPVSII